MIKRNKVAFLQILTILGLVYKLYLHVFISNPIFRFNVELIGGFLVFKHKVPYELLSIILA